MSLIEDDGWAMPVDPVLVLPSELEWAVSMRFDDGLLAAACRRA